MSLLIWIEADQGVARRASFDVLNMLVGRGAAGETWPGEASAVCFGTEDCCTDLAARLGALGVARLFVLRPSTATQEEPPDIKAQALVWLLERLRAEAPHERVLNLCAAGTAVGRDLLARVAATTDAPLMQDCLRVDLASGEAVKLLFSGRATARYALEGPLRLFGVRPGGHAGTGSPQAVGGQGSMGSESAPSEDKPGEAVAGPCVVVPLEPPRQSSRLRILERVRESGETDLQEASILLAGGRPAGHEGFQLLRDCAAGLGQHGKAGTVAVAASRSAVDLGFAPPALQVGQTGQVVSPDLYIACGISGSVYHTVGIRTAGTVVCVNTDPNAPMFTRADYGIHDDLFAVLPLLMQELSRDAGGSAQNC